VAFPTPLTDPDFSPDAWAAERARLQQENDKLRQRLAAAAEHARLQQENDELRHQLTAPGTWWGAANRGGDGAVPPSLRHLDTRDIDPAFLSTRYAPLGVFCLVHHLSALICDACNVFFSCALNAFKVGFAAFVLAQSPSTHTVADLFPRPERDRQFELDPTWFSVTTLTLDHPIDA
jgi:hypothetical protein